MIKYKTFNALAYSDTTWTGGGAGSCNDYLQEIDKDINDFASSMGLQVESVSFSYANKDIQHGPSERNTTRLIYCMAAVTFK